MSNTCIQSNTREIINGEVFIDGRHVGHVDDPGPKGPSIIPILDTDGNPTGEHTIVYDTV